ncbi:ferroxidase fet3 [Phytophthora pseudosyringae]|uniref:Ferroxidase fet3 n=1 Tax=Phytophthora pseudosyringae TaxID=221518 RepID=A0A8T1V5U5_9STRA|nr:ferroxidase fet3 [Phytophthora pseudosyringae]
MGLVLLLFLLTLLCLTAQPRVDAAACMGPVVFYDFRVTYIASAFDGVALTSFGINDRPSHEALIEATLGQEVQVTVTNELEEPTCLHWHGLKQLGTQEMDGLSGITQCYIPPNATAVYRFAPDKAGSFWWHSHHSTQYSYGLRGPLVVHPRDDQRQPWELDIDAEYNVQLADIYHGDPGVPPMWDSILINNRGRYNCTAAASHGFTDCSEDQPLARFRFEAGKTYLLRLMAMSALAPFAFSIDEHQFRVIAADGDSLVPTDLVTNITINIGQRYDLLVEAKDATNGSFWMRATGLNGLPWTAATGANAGEGFNADGLAVVDYDECDEDSEPTTQRWNETSTVGEFDFTPVNATTLPATPDDRVIIEFLFPGIGQVAVDGSGFNQFFVPDFAPLLAIADGLTTEELPASTIPREIRYGDHVEIVLVNEQNEQHPFHLHGHSPWVVGSGQATLAQVQSSSLSPLKLSGAMFRDVYTVPPCPTDGANACTGVGYIVLRLEADNPGVWMMHCHIDWHLDDGLAMIFIEGEAQLQEAGVDAFSNSILSVCGSNFTGAPFNATTTVTVP